MNNKILNTIKIFAGTVIISSLLTILINLSATPFLDSNYALIAKIIITAFAVFPRGILYFLPTVKAVYAIVALWHFLIIVAAAGILVLNNKCRTGFVMLNMMNLVLFTYSWVSQAQPGFTAVFLLRAFIWLVCAAYILFFIHPKVKREFRK